MASKTRLRALTFAVAACATAGCSLLTSLDGLAGKTADPPSANDSASSDSLIDGGTANDGAGADGARDSGASDSGMGPLTKRTWRQSNADGPPARHSVRMIYDDARNVSVLFGGRSDTVPGNETWEWDGVAWSRRVAASGPPSLRAPAVAYDSVHDKTLVFAGPSASPWGMWQWDGTSWSFADGAPPPPSAPYGAAMTYDRARRVAVLFGGSTGETHLDEVWEWSSEGGFVKRTFGAKAPGRRAHTMVYDSARARVLVFGGFAQGNAVSNELWEYDGTTWFQRTESGPSPRAAPCAAYDEARRVTVVFGGRLTADASLADTWEWDGAVWRSGPPGPPARRSCAMAFDAARNAVVMYGGGSKRAASKTESLGDTWLYE